MVDRSSLLGTKEEIIGQPLKMMVAAGKRNIAVDNKQKDLKQEVRIFTIDDIDSMIKNSDKDILKLEVIKKSGQVDNKGITLGLKDAVKRRKTNTHHMRTNIQEIKDYFARVA